MRQPNVTVYGSAACPDTQRARDFLDAQSVAYEYKDVDESPELNPYLADLNHGTRVIPTIRLNNMILINPSEQELSRELKSVTSLIDNQGGS
ncbi:glutaredoxin family protein [Singulisphaera acidiphila]|uniref:Glutaredoxin-like protein n=1 Tax=Singulisphaera acidiphila (strain ATCC BAA-1392 / DSM 18658 / VKM B-2454 / MOB10) TaxID=886293 RepID=L0DK07_SINAD|nr:glutaredoxin family protein [Singulisphaera acidiphila]AGA29724.1 glutaredoxin-like protein [Singulisphaera acidiphila DSM 18658]